MPIVRDLPELADPIKSMKIALGQEIKAAIDDPGRSLRLTEGRRVFEGSNHYLYSFKIELPVTFPPETPITVAVDEKHQYPGFLVGADDFDVVVALKEDIGHEVPEARLSSDPSFILAQLMQRLDDLSELDRDEFPLPLALLGSHGGGTEEDSNAVKITMAALSRMRNPSLQPNDFQQRVIARAVARQFHAVWGPPGTGKTASLAQSVRALVLKNERVLVMAHANVAVDVAMLRIAEAFEGCPELSGGKVLRVGYPQLPAARSRDAILPDRILAARFPETLTRLEELERERDEITRKLRKLRSAAEQERAAKRLSKVREELDDIRKELTAARQELVMEAVIVGATLAKLAIDPWIWGWKPDSVIVDEASMAPFPFIFASAFQSAKRVHVFGDFRQLPPIHLSKRAESTTWLGRDAFEIAGIKDRLDKGLDDPRVTLLETQYRMTEPISHVVSQLAYDGRLSSDPASARTAASLSTFDPWRGESIVICDTSSLGGVCFKEPRHGSYSRVNIIHAFLAASLAAKAVQSGCQNVGVVTPYRAQARLIQKIVEVLGVSKLVRPGTVHKFQGSEADVIIYDNVDAAPEQGPSKLTGKDADTALRLMNVGASRARGKLVAVADFSFVSSTHGRKSAVRRALKLMEQNGLRVEMAIEDTLTFGDPAGPVSFHLWHEVERMIRNDAAKVTNAVKSNLPARFSSAPGIERLLSDLAERGDKLAMFAPLPLAALVEQTNADVRLSARPGGFFLSIGKDKAFAGPADANGVFVRVADRKVVGHLMELVFGTQLAIPTPNANRESQLDVLCGQCTECGEDRRPREFGEQGWLLSCPDKNHSKSPVNEIVLKRLIEVFAVSCPECAASGVPKTGRHGLFIACPDYAGGCTGKPSQLKDLFPGV